MGVIKVEKTKNYTVMSNVFLRDPRLTLKAKGLLANLMTHSNAYEITVNGIVATSKEGKASIYSAIDELIEYGYCERTQEREGKTWGKVIYTFREEPKNTSLDTFEQLSDFQQTVFQQTENPPQRNTNIKEVSKERNNNKNNLVHSSNDTSEIPDLFASTVEFEKELKDELGRKFVEKVIACKKNEDGGPDGSMSDKSLKEWKEEKFEEFWERYNKKKSKDPCKAKWMKLKSEEIEKALAIVDDYVLTTPDIQYRKLPLTWINQKCWNDDLTEDLKKYAPNRRLIKNKKEYRDNDWF